MTDLCLLGVLKLDLLNDCFLLDDFYLSHRIGSFSGFFRFESVIK
jgi:hypothetical protein